MLRRTCRRSLLTAFLMSALMLLAFAPLAQAKSIEQNAPQHQASSALALPSVQFCLNHPNHPGCAQVLASFCQNFPNAPLCQQLGLSNGNGNPSNPSNSTIPTSAPTANGYQTGYTAGLKDGDTECNEGVAAPGTVRQQNPGLTGFDAGYAAGLKVGITDCGTAGTGTTNFYQQGKTDGITDGKLECAEQKPMSAMRSNGAEQGYDAGYTAGLPIGFHDSGQC